MLIARALASDPALLIMDEPTASIDAKGQTAIYRRLKSMLPSKTVIVVSHDLNVLMGYATKVAYVQDRTLYLHDGPQWSREGLQKHLGRTVDHVCPVELFNPGGGHHHD